MPTTHLPLSELQTALYNRLNSILSIGVLDHATENADLPYASIGEFTVAPNPTKTDTDVDVIGTIHIWSKYEGYKECQKIADTIIASLTEEDLTLTGDYVVLHTALESFSTSAEFNGTEIIRRGILAVRWLIS